MNGRGRPVSLAQQRAELFCELQALCAEKLGHTREIVRIEHAQVATVRLLARLEEAA